MTPQQTATQIDRKLVAELAERQKAKLDQATPKSAAMFERAHKVMPQGVPSSFQHRDPYPVYIDRGQGAEVHDVDGRRYVDFHNGFGVMCVGHANPKVAGAVAGRMRRGTHFAAPTEESIVVAEELQRRFGMHAWRFANSGTEATMDAIHMARGFTDRDTILKIEGSYHGHHDAVMVSVYPELADLGERDDPVSVPYGKGYPRAYTELTRSVPFNDAEALERVLEKLNGQVAGLIMEPAMMNINIVMPEDGYLERVRELTSRHGVALIFDEVKTGCTIAAGGAVERFGIEPDIVCLAKATFGGLPGGAVGATAEIMDLVESNDVHQMGTFNGNPLVMAAASATLTEVLTADSYAQLGAINRRVMSGCDAVIEKYGLPAHTVGMGAKGCVTFAPQRVRDYRDYLANVDGKLAELAWLYHMNHGIFMTPGVEEEWTVSVAHTDEHADAYVRAFEEFARDLAGS